MTKYGGAIAACGLAAGMDLPDFCCAVHPARCVATGHRFCDVSQVCAVEAWRRLAADLDPAKLAAITTEIGLGDVIAAGARILAGEIRGRVVVRID